MRKLLFLFILFTLTFSSLAQHLLPSKGEVFNDAVLPSVFISIHPDSLALILDDANKFSDYEYHAQFVFDNGTMRDSVANVGFRLRGNTSRSAQKKSFKVSFNSFVSGQKFYGLENMNINGEHNDPSITRSKLCFDLLDYLEVPAARANHVKLYINGAYFGLYMNVEHYDEEFTKSRFAGQGNLYKCTYGADLSYKGSNIQNYKQQYYEIHNPNSPSAYEDLVRFIDILNNTPDSNFECELEHVFNVNSYLKSIVMDVLTGNWDGPNYNMNNFYLYFNNSTGQFEYIPFDLDNTFGIDWFGKDWSSRNVYSWSKGGEDRPLYMKILARPKYAERFTYLLDKTLKEYFNPTAYAPKLTAIRNIISSAAAADTIRGLDYGYSQADFINSYATFNSAHVKFGLADYIANRHSSATSQLQALGSLGAIPYWHSVISDFKTDSITFSISAKGSLPIKHVLLTYNWGSQSAIWIDTMLVGINKSLFSKTLAWHPTVADVSYTFSIVTSDDAVSTYPACNMFMITKNRADIPLYINEVMADNSTSHADENGLYSDWIEFFYNGNSPLDLSDYYVTDNLSNPFKYRMASQTISKNSYPILWADNLDNGNHTSFKLSKSGESVAIFDKNGTLVDAVNFGPQTTDVSYGRQTDGQDFWISFSTPTPGASNNTNAEIKEYTVLGAIYPNPTRGELSLFNITEGLSYELININGGIVQTGVTDNVLSISGQVEGMYFMKIYSASSTYTYKIILIN